MAGACRPWVPSFRFPRVAGGHGLGQLAHPEERDRRVLFHSRRLFDRQADGPMKVIHTEIRVSPAIRERGLVETLETAGPPAG